jgi:hypothetical protein
VATSLFCFQALMQAAMTRVLSLVPQTVKLEAPNQSRSKLLHATAGGQFCLARQLSCQLESCGLMGCDDVSDVAAAFEVDHRDEVHSDCEE